MNRPLVMDDDGQPAPAAINAGRRQARSVDELLGFVKGILADDVVHESEIIALAKWLCANAETDEWPVGALVERIDHILTDGRIDPEEIAELHEFFSEMVGAGPGEFLGRNASTKLPLTEPLPLVLVPQRVFVFTGKFVSGTRAACQGRVRQLGGLAENQVTRRTHYLVIGQIGSRDWIHSTHGRKIELAVEYAQKGLGISIVSEEHWLRQVALREQSAHLAVGSRVRIHCPQSKYNGVVGEVFEIEESSQYAMIDMPKGTEERLEHIHENKIIEEMKRSDKTRKTPAKRRPKGDPQWFPLYWLFAVKEEETEMGTAAGQ